MSKADEQYAASLISHELGITFRNSKFQLGAWGTVDEWAMIAPNHYLLLEVETSQKHPNTNVLKVWPYLEENPLTTVILVQVFFPHSSGLNSSRGMLCSWLGKQLEHLMPSRFRYQRLVIPVDENFMEGCELLKSTLMEWKETST